MKKWLRKIGSGFLSLAMAATAFAATPAMTESVSAATSYYAFDFGAGGTASGYTGVTASTGYSASTGYGFNTPANMKDVAAAGSGALSDAVQFTTSGLDSTNTFNVDLDNGLYQVTVVLGNTMRTSVAAEGVFQLMNLTGDNATDTFQIPVTDGQLNLCCMAGKDGYAYTLSTLTISQISTDATMAPTIWLCGDSTVCNYYPLDTSVQCGWGQLLKNYVDTDTYQIRNMATGGQYAKGFYDSGQFAAILKYIKPGDYYFISIGINDSNYSNADEYYETLTAMTQQVKAKGATVIIVAQQGRSGDISNSALSATSSRWYNGTAKQVAEEQSVQCIDLFNLFYLYCQSVGQEAATALYIKDGLHPNRDGATVLARLISEQVTFGEATPITAASFASGATYMIKNVNSGLYMEVANGTAADGTNVQQWGASGASRHNVWKLLPSGNDDGYYYIYSMLGDGNTYLLDVDAANTANGTNIGIYSNTTSDAQLYKFELLSDGNYVIHTKVSQDASCVEIANADTASGANVQEWELNGNACQKWTLESASVSTEIPVTYAIGDLNNDQSIDAFDNAALKRGLLSSFTSTAAQKAADVNADSDVTVADLILHTQYLLREITEFPAMAITEQRYYAVDASYYNAISETSNAGYTGEAYLNLDNETGSYAEWTVNAANSGNYLVTFVFANGSTANRSMQLMVNGNTEDFWLQDFLTTSAWTTWNTVGIVLPLNAGQNTIRATSYTAEGGPNLDYITIQQTEEPIAATYVATETVETSSSNTTIYIAGDSTAQTYRASYAPQQGWGAYVADYFDDTVTVSNQAIAGRSSKSFYDNGRLDTILSTIQSGDFLMVQFGINDSASSIAERYAPVCGSVENATEGSFEYYIKFYVEGALAKGATPILLSPTLGLKAYSNGTFVNSYSNYAGAMQSIASYYNIPYIDLNSLMVAHYNTIGYDAAYNYHLISTELSDTDMTHFTETGATNVAKLVATAIEALNLSISDNVVLN